MLRAEHLHELPEHVRRLVGRLVLGIRTRRLRALRRRRGSLLGLRVVVRVVVRVGVGVLLLLLPRVVVLVRVLQRFHRREALHLVLLGSLVDAVHLPQAGEVQRARTVVAELERGVHDDVQAHLVALPLVQRAEHLLRLPTDANRERAPPGLGVPAERHLRDEHELAALVNLDLDGLPGGDDRAPELALHDPHARATRRGGVNREDARRKPPPIGSDGAQKLKLVLVIIMISSGIL